MRPLRQCCECVPLCPLARCPQAIYVSPHLDSMRVFGRLSEAGTAICRRKLVGIAPEIRLNRPTRNSINSPVSRGPVVRSGEPRPLLDSSSHLTFVVEP